MNILQRLSLAAQLILSDTRALATVLPAWRDNQPTYSAVNFESMVRSGWRRNELIYACISKTANTSRSLSLNIIGRNDKEVEQHPVKKLIQQPNPYMNESDLWAAVIIFLKLAGVAYFEKERSAAGRVVRLWPLRPDYVKPILTQSGLTGYEIAPPGVTPVRLPENDVLRFSLFDPLGLFQHYPPVAVAGRSGDSDNAVTDYIKLFFDEGGVPPGIFTTEQQLTTSDIDRIRASWRTRYGGWKNWKEPIVLSSGTTYQQTGASAVNDTGWDILDARNEARICMVLDVPPIVVGAQVGLARSTFANYAEARQSWWEDSILPMFENFMDTIYNGLIKEFDSSLKAAWDTQRVPALQATRDAARAQALDELVSGAITRNQYNDIVGLPQMGPRGDVFIMPMNVVEIPSGQLAGSELSTLPLGSRGVLPAYAGGSERITIEKPTDEHKHRPHDQKERRKIERELEDDMNDYFDNLLSSIREQMGNLS